ncbi:LPD7 domain-containing protein [Pectobacterium versatile]|uniref:LPD7 domain-containing protein n=1 Tax=Pectobacterium versatile TaxID=2488639 RepID=UPI001F2E2C7B|nr:LPD7 domain-containing protein [Pectobacterium versatile]
MIIRLRGYNDGAKEYLEEGVKNGRELTRDELDDRAILFGNLDVTQKVYQSIPDNGQERYISVTLSFLEDDISIEKMRDITEEYRQFLMSAYHDNEYNFYAEAHLPKIKKVEDKKTGEMIDRKPHVHIIIPEVNLLSGNIINPRGDHKANEKYFEAFQEYINQKYSLVSPRERVRVDPTNSADVLSRYKGDDFQSKNREFKQKLVKDIIDKDIQSRDGFYAHVSSFGETRVRNEGKENEYIAVKLPGDAKFTNLKESIFCDDFIVRREIKKPPLDSNVIQQRLHEWGQRSKELKYISKAGESFRSKYKNSSPDEKLKILAKTQADFYKTKGVNDELYISKRQRGNQRSITEIGSETSASVTDGLQSMHGREMANIRDGGNTQREMFLPADARFLLGQPEAIGGNTGLRHALRTGRGRSTSSDNPKRTSSVPSRSPAAYYERWSGSQQRDGQKRGTLAGDIRLPAYATNRKRVPTINDIEQRSNLLLKRGDQARGKSFSLAKGLPIPNVKESSASSILGRSPTAYYERWAGSQQRNGQKRGILAGEIRLPAYATSRKRVATINDIEKRSNFLLKRGDQAGGKSFSLVKRQWPHRNKNSSSVAAWFLRQNEQNQILPEHRRAIRDVDSQFYTARRLIYQDERLTRSQKTQYLSVLTFERLKAHQHITHPDNLENNDMGSEDIRKFIKEKNRSSRNTIGAGAEKDRTIPPASRRFSRIVLKMKNQIESGLDTNLERQKTLTSADLYTRRSKLSKNVHYMDKKTDHTLFVDTGTSIAVRREGMSPAALAVALELAKERFGSTLTIKGTDEFKKQVIDVVAKNNLDIHFTDKSMNRQLEERKAELALELDGQTIEQPENIHASSETQSHVEKSQPASDATTSGDTPFWQTIVHLQGKLISHGKAPLNHEKGKEESYFVTIKDSQGAEKTHWSADLQDIMKGQRRGKNISLSLNQSRPVQINVRDAKGNSSIQEAVRHKWELSRLPNDKTTEAKPDRATISEPQVPVSPEENTPISNEPTKQKIDVHEGVLVACGPAPYRFKPDMNKPEDERNDSFYVKLKMDNGKTRTPMGGGAGGGYSWISGW